MNRPTAPPPGADELLEFWFAGAARATEASEIAERNRIWFAADEAFDAACRERFAGTVEAALAGALDGWAGEARGRLALVLALDQLTRNLFRGTARAFAGDPRALGLTLEAIEGGADLALAPLERVFLYMPLQHAEDLQVQRRSIEVFATLAASGPPGLRPVLDSNLGYAREHHDLIERFGRFPHRNEVLGRDPSAAERAYLEGGGKRYGQG